MTAIASPSSSSPPSSARRSKGPINLDTPNICYRKGNPLCAMHHLHLLRYDVSEKMEGADAESQEHALDVIRARARAVAAASRLGHDKDRGFYNLEGGSTSNHQEFDRMKEELATLHPKSIALDVRTGNKHGFTQWTASDRLPQPKRPDTAPIASPRGKLSEAALAIGLWPKEFDPSQIDDHAREMKRIFKHSRKNFHLEFS